ncbi:MULTISPECIES: class V aminotransferase [unclassified Novosphingobium]|uniref:class V aminotransferase n=1 Tax=unclassified Novosphingobium TaxID=2644732 RepID=UPI000ED91447|nr:MULTISPECIES: class V aminotransferase [unclassified Novosphingobium]HCF24518.1 class V aminotransferase [Novosphingobium sp.]HQV03331.1 class V aminotransferase [Novosphingobium sp.]
MTFKHLFSRALEAAPSRLHFAAHSHHLWPDASYAGQIAAWEEAAMLADHKWDKIFGEVIPEAQRHIARELSLPDPATIAFSPNTHDFLVRIVSAMPMDRPRVLASDCEFHSFRRQSLRWAEAGRIALTTVPLERLVEEAETGAYDLIFASQVQFNSGRVLPGIERLAALARPEGPWVVIDGYHGFMATPTDLSAVADRVFYLAGGYKYAMAGEGVCFLHAPAGYGPRPEVTGWYAAFDDLAARQGGVGYAPDGRRFLGSTFDPSGLYRFNAVQRMLKAEGLDTAAISAHCEKLKARFLAVDPLPQLAMLSEPQARFIALQGPAAPALYESLTARNVVTDLRGDVLRIGFGLYQNEADVDALLAMLRT